MALVNKALINIAYKATNNYCAINVHAELN